MPALSKAEAIEKLAENVQNARPANLTEIHGELFPEQPTPSRLTASDLVRHIRSGLAAEEVVDLWNVVFPGDRKVWYDEEAESIHYNEEMVGNAD